MNNHDGWAAAVAVLVGLAISFQRRTGSVRSWVVSRGREPSTWAGVGVVVTAVTGEVPPIGQLVASVAAGVAIALPDRKGAGE